MNTSQTNANSERTNETGDATGSSPSALWPVAILAGGLAARMHPHTERIPKALLDLNGEPFIAHQLRLLASQGVADVVLCVAHHGRMIEEFVGDGHRFRLNVRYSQDGDRLLGTAGALRQALPLLGDAFFVMYGDSYLPCDFCAIQQSFVRSGRLGLMTVFQNDGLFDASNVEYADGEIRIYDKKRKTSAMRHIDYGLELFQAPAFAGISADEPCDLVVLCQDLLARRQLASFVVPERFYEIGSLQGWHETATYLRSRTPQERQVA
jgi:NDP-sugar pyrophosphorylase family protein